MYTLHLLRDITWEQGGGNPAYELRLDDPRAVPQQQAGCMKQNPWQRRDRPSAVPTARREVTSTAARPIDYRDKSPEPLAIDGEILRGVPAA